MNVSGDPVVRIRFDRATCRTCPVRSACTWAKQGPRQLTVRPKAYHEAIRKARARQETAEFKATYALRAGVESSLSQGTRRFEMRRSRYVGRARTHVQQILVAMAMNLVRVMAWLWNETVVRADVRSAASQCSLLDRCHGGHWFVEEHITQQSQSMPSSSSSPRRSSKRKRPRWHN